MFVGHSIVYRKAARDVPIYNTVMVNTDSLAKRAHLLEIRYSENPSTLGNILDRKYEENALTCASRSSELLGKTRRKPRRRCIGVCAASTVAVTAAAAIVQPFH